MINNSLGLITLAAVLLAQDAYADQTMTTHQLEALVTGNTLYVEIPEGAPGVPDGGTAPIYYAEDGSAAAQLPGGPKLVGTWSFEADRYCIDWDNGPKNSCTQLVRGSDGYRVMDTKLGQPRGLVTRIVVGNPENL
ncbi:hypothetical protein OS190_03415 [Sulfitobacter sp. F26204]|uniref:hypothetical protein n=1 Tax=Sulfitobacter sp. F26204 TaxID=2996014 RepID=UPI00225DE364|nr:hypothetical protein [Sulfitobacter sp. F26204]MCX7558600.1 hypothetical protein [Sulfitobacter sp. F26204]